MDSEPKLKKSNSVACLLIVNEIKELPTIAIKSILASSDLDVVVGYIHESDIVGLPTSSRVTFLKLDLAIIGLPLFENNSNNYSGWFTENFFRIVQLKWLLIKSQLKSDYELIIYSDLDVVWISDMEHHLARYFENFTEVDAVFQSFTYDPESPRLCMGFAGFRNTVRSMHLVEEGHKLHSKVLQENPRFGDDDAITLMYRNLNFPSWIRELPQTSVAVGSSINLNSQRSKFPGVTGLSPHLFHANFTVGETNKRLMLRLVLNKSMRKQLGIPLSFKWRLLLLAKRVKALSK